jgi:hypothetical protein
MKGNQTMKMITNNTYLALALFAFACFGLAPQARAVTPAPDGGYPNQNTAEGEDALFGLTSGLNNTAIGFHSLYANTSGSSNTGVGLFTLTANTFGTSNTALGVLAMASNTIGDGNTAVGGNALDSNTGGFQNTAVGGFALTSNTTGSNNTAVGYDALGFCDTGSSNIAVGFFAGVSITGSGSNNIDIGNFGVSGESSVIRIGALQTATYIAGIANTPLVTGSAVAVGITPDGQLGVRASSGRYKQNIEPMDKASEAILALKPVTFRYKHELDPEGIPQFGLVAEQVEKVNPDLVARDEQGKPYTVRYEAVNAMLLNEFLKEHRKVEKLEAALRAVNARLAEQDAKIQKAERASQTQ